MRKLITQFEFRWTIGNILGWSVGLYIGGGLLSVVGGIGGALAAGALAGATVGIAQWGVLRLDPGGMSRRWALLSALGGGMATLPAYLSGAALIAGPQVGYFVIGAVYGGLFASVQWIMLRTRCEAGASLWIIANLLAGGLCGCLSMTASLPGLPWICSPGPVVFGILTGITLQRLRQNLKREFRR
ncbi:MAG: hypothetical protein K8J31_13015 [Anaerolineae bacterium]|nr:hypothetical protein [Anaerolineae bacterium]